MTIFKNNNNGIKISFAVIVVAFLVLSFKLTLNKYDSSANIITDHFKDRDSLIEQAILSDTSSLVQIHKLRKQFQIIGEIKESYLYMASHFNSMGYTFTIFFSISSIITAILTFLLLRSGWDKTENDYLKISFMIMFFASTLFGILPNVFNNKENTKNNLTKYNYYSGLQFDIYEAVMDNQGFIKRGHPDSLNPFISAINKGIKENQDLYFDIYTDKVPKDIKLPLGN